MCEAMLEYKGSYEQAIVCAKKAAGYNTSYPDWRIFLCRIVLENAERAMAGLAEGSSSSGGALEGMPELDPGQVLGDTLQVTVAQIYLHINGLYSRSAVYRLFSLWSAQKEIGYGLMFE